MTAKTIDPACGVPLRAPAFTPEKWGSPLNWLPDVRAQFHAPDRVLIHDVTLRDGEQTPRVAFTPEEKIAIAVELDGLGVHSIEPGLPVTAEDREVIKTLASMNLRARIVPLARVAEADVRAAIDAKANGMVLEFGINPYFVRDVYKTNPPDLIERISELAAAARQAGMYVEFMGWDVMRIDGLDYPERFFKRLVERAQLDRVTIADTFGMGHPFTTFHYIRKLKEWTGLPVGFHIHNDFGLAAAGALMAVTAGADMVHSSVNGLGERSGNVATEEIAMLLQHLLDIEAGIDLTRLKSVSDTVAEISKARPALNKAIIGEGLFEVESGIAVHAMQATKNTPLRNLIFPFPPETVGRKPAAIIYGVGTGNASVAQLLESKGLSATEEQRRQIAERLKHLGRLLKNGVPDSLIQRVIEDCLRQARTPSGGSTPQGS